MDMSRIALVLALRVVAATALVAPTTTEARYSPETIERVVRVFFPESPVMIDIARCESGLRQYSAPGMTLRGGWQGKMIGLFQLHETYHRSVALSKGYNIDTLLGNVLYARELHRAEGTVPWRSSQHCWGS